MAADGKERAPAKGGRPWAPFVLLFAVGAALVWFGWRVDLGPLRSWATGAGAGLVAAVMLLALNRVRKRGRHRRDR